MRDRRTDGRTNDDSIYGTSIVSRGKNYKFSCGDITKLQSTEVGLCKHFVKNTVDELATVHECVRDDYLVYLVKLVILFYSRLVVYHVW